MAELEGILQYSLFIWLHGHGLREKGLIADFLTPVEAFGKSVKDFEQDMHSSTSNSLSPTLSDTNPAD